MRSFLLTMAVALVTALTAAPAAHADRASCPASLESSYSKHYAKVAKLHGKRAPGRNIRKHGVLFKGTVFDATCGELRRSLTQLKRLEVKQRYATLRTEAADPQQPPAGVKTAVVDGTEGSGGWAIPEHIVMCESGGNYNARNPSGAYGAYQIMPGTAAGYGCSLATPAGQDRCAAKIYAAEGSAPWVCG